MAEGARLPVLRRGAAAGAPAAGTGDIAPDGRRGRGLPMTSSSPTSSRSPWCARTAPPARRARASATAGCASAFSPPCPTRSPPSQAPRVDEIVADLAAPPAHAAPAAGRRRRGKTVVALLAAAAVIEAGRQAALMAPTEILARQHLADALRRSPKRAGIRLALPHRPRARPRARRRRSRGSLPARSISWSAPTRCSRRRSAFATSALAVVDEQHRFGVHQRLALTRKGQARRRAGDDRDADPAHAGRSPSSATWIAPSCARNRAGRQPIDTRTVPLGRINEVVDGLGRALAEGRRIYWVCPLVSESEVTDLAAAEERFKSLRQRFGETVDLVHGQMKGADKDAAMARFASGASRLLVATTVIEVGVDVPEATVMVIEHAERFGLAQLHQLRGRIGRGHEKSTCLLLYRPPLGQFAKARLAVMRETEDGFRIAEEDLKLRGEGDVLGTRQSGTPGFRLARIEAHRELIAAARDDAALMLSRDPELSTPRGQALRHLLYLFERDEAIRLLRAG